MKQRILVLIALSAGMLSLLLACPGPSYEELAETLLEGAPQESEKAAKLLASNPLALPRCAATLVVRDENIRYKFLHVLDLARERSLAPMTDNIRYVRISKKHFLEFAGFFQKRGAKGYDALLESYRLHALTMKDAIDRKDFSASALSHLERMKDLERVMISHPDKRADGLPDLLFHPYDVVRAHIARLLCIKGWSPADNEDPKKALLYYTHLVSVSDCPEAKKATDRVVEIGRKNLDDFLAVEDKYPAPAGTRYEVLVRIATDQVVEYAKKICLETDNHFLFLQYYKVLKRIGSPAGKAALVEILKRQDIRQLFGDVQIDKVENP